MKLKNSYGSVQAILPFLMHRANANNLVAKVITEHKQNDITKDVYTH